MAAGGRIRVVTYNILKGGARRTGELAAVLVHCRPDLVLLQEAFDPDGVAALGRALGMRVVVSRPSQSAAALTCLPVRDWHWHRGARPGRAFLEMELEQPRWRVFCVHLSPYFWPWREARRRREVRALLELAGAGDGAEVLLAGDFNAIAPGDEPSWTGMPLRVRAAVCLGGGDVSRAAIGEVLGAGYCDAAAWGGDDPPAHTLPAQQPKARLDYVFASPRLAPVLTAYRVVDDLPEAGIASDHLAVVADFEAPDGVRLSSPSTTDKRTSLP